MSLLIKAGREHDAALFAQEAAHMAVRSDNKPKAIELLEKHWR